MFIIAKRIILFTTFTETTNLDLFGVMETLFIGKNPVFLPVTESTNSYAIEMLKNVNPPEGTIIYTDHQTRGRGQRGTSWESEPGSNMMVSVILKPAFLSLKKQHFLYQVAALACYDTIAQLLDNSQFDIKIKWPNDILVNRRKIAGVLIENNLVNNDVIWSVVGVGINVNQTFFNNLEGATSLKLIADVSFDTRDVMLKFCYWLEKRYLSLMAGKFDLLGGEYLSNFFGIKNSVWFELNGAVRRMFVEGISPAGLLLLKGEDEILREVDVKEVKWLI